MIWPVLEQRLAVGDHVANARGRADQLGDDDIGPGPAQHQPQDFRDLGGGAGNQHPLDDARRLRAQRVGGLHQVLARRAHADRDHQQDLEHRADEDHQHLLQLADARPQDQQRNEGRRRQVAAERDEGLQKRLQALVRPHGDAQRHGDERRQHEAAEHPRNRHADVVDEVELGEQQPAFARHGHRAGQERGRDITAQGEDAPDGRRRAQRIPGPAATARGDSPAPGEPASAAVAAPGPVVPPSRVRCSWAYLMKLASYITAKSSGALRITPASSRIFDASFMKDCSSPAKNFWFAALSCQRRKEDDLAKASPVCLTAAPMISLDLTGSALIMVRASKYALTRPCAAFGLALSQSGAQPSVSITIG